MGHNCDTNLLLKAVTVSSSSSWFYQIVSDHQRMRGLFSKLLDLSHLNPATVSQVWAAFRCFNRFVIIGRLDDEITSHYLFGFSVRAVNHARHTIAHRDVAPPFVFEFLAAAEFTFGFDLAPPGGVLANDLLHLLRRDV